MKFVGIKSYIKHFVSFLLHGEARPIYANISYLTPSNKLKGKKIIITGGGRGLGFAMAKRFVAEGASVLIAGRNEQVLKDSAAELNCSYLPLDVQKVESFQIFIEEAKKKLGGINCLVNNAGISLHEQSIYDVTEEQFNSQIYTNFRGPYFLTQCFLSSTISSDSNEIKKVLFISSETGMTVDERPYGLTKAAINSLVQRLAHKYVRDNIRVNAIAPGVTISDMVGKKNDGDLSGAGGATGRYYCPEEIAEIASFLLCDASNCLNGQILVCNEGKTINARWR